MPTLSNLKPLQRTALLAALDAPGHHFNRTRAGYVPAGATEPVFTYRLMRMLEAAYLVSFDDAGFPSYATLTKPGVELAQQLRTEQLARASTRAARHHMAGLTMALLVVIGLAACVPEQPAPRPRPVAAQDAWMLDVCTGVSWGGCGRHSNVPFPTEESCYRSLATLKTGDQPIAESETKRNTVAFCRPATPNERVHL